MVEPFPLPESLRGRAFSRAQAARAGVGDGRLRRKDLQRIFHGVRSTETPAGLVERCRAYLRRLKPGQFFTHQTAAALHGLTLPSDTDHRVLHLGAVRPADAPHSDGVRGHRVTVGGDRWRIEDLPVPDPTEVFCQLGAELGLEDLVVIADELLNMTALPEDDARNELVGRIARVRRIGGARLVRAVGLARRGSRSPAETRIRLVLERAGLPTPELNAPIQDRGAGRYLGSPDFVWRHQRVVVEYEGEDHRLKQERFRRDIIRYDDLMADGWRVVRATGDHLTVEGRRDLVRRVRRALDAGVQP